MTKNISTAVIIPNYNGLGFMEVCMEALSRQTFRDFYVIIVDNGSTDGSVEYIKGLLGETEEESGQNKEPEGRPNAKGLRVKAILLSENTGFSGAVNAGIKMSLDDGAEFAILLNNDTEAEEDYIRALVECIQKDKRIFSVSPLMIQYHNRELIDDAGDGYNLLGWGFQMGVGHKTGEKAYLREREIFSSCAGAAIYRTEIFKELELSVGEYFDMEHFAYLEDIDIGYRARIRGYRNLYCPKARVFHVGSGTSGSKYNSFKVKLAARNNVWLNYKNMPVLQLIINLPSIAAGIFIKMLFFYKKGFLKDYLKGLSEGIRRAREMRKVKFRLRDLTNYVFIEWLLIENTFIYAKEFLLRKLKN